MSKVGGESGGASPSGEANASITRGPGGKIEASAKGGATVIVAGRDAHAEGAGSGTLVQLAGRDATLSQATQAVTSDQAVQRALDEMRVLLEESIGQFLTQVAKLRSEHPGTDPSTHAMIEDLWLKHASQQIKSRGSGALKTLIDKVTDPAVLAELIKVIA